MVREHVTNAGVRTGVTKCTKANSVCSDVGIEEIDRLPRGDEMEMKIRTEAAKTKKRTESVAVATPLSGWRGRVEPGGLLRGMNIKGWYKHQRTGECTTMHPEPCKPQNTGEPRRYCLQIGRAHV